MKPIQVTIEGGLGAGVTFIAEAIYGLATHDGYNACVTDAEPEGEEEWNGYDFIIVAKVNK